MSDPADNAGEDFADCLDALAGIYSAEAVVHRAEADRLTRLADLARAHHREPHLTAIVSFRTHSADQVSARAAAASLAAEACIAGAEALRSMPRAGPPSR